jgi:ATP-binding cassette, subfamily A (ABC1), member 3
VLLGGLRKVYPGLLKTTKVAVRNMHFSVPVGQCFGFLGINGAGKTTTLKMLTGAVYPTSGEAYLNGLSVTTEQRQIRRYLGYCPQFDAFTGTLTARQTLTMFGHIKGIDNAILPKYVDSMINLIGLSEYADRPAMGYSGGNKRKLSVGVALMGNPPMVFLDEPSTGMDPASRRSMWELIQKTMANRAVILTTHSMEECEALCQRIGIMVSGELKCVGSSQHLRHRFGNGYQLDARLRSERDQQENDLAMETLIHYVQETFKGAEIVEEQSQSIKFRLKKDLGCSLGEAFDRLEKESKRLSISEYSLSEVSLEQIFIYFARHQREEADIDLTLSKRRAKRQASQAKPRVADDEEKKELKTYKVLD